MFYLLYLCVALFVPYLTLNDYLPVIQDDQLNEQVLDALEAGNAERRFAENWAMSKFRGKLRQQYDLDAEFTPTLPYDFNKAYGAGDRVTIDFDAWVSGTSYNQYSLVVYQGEGYLCLLDNNDTDFDSNKWQGLGLQYSIYHIPLPYPLFSQNIQLSKGAYTDGFYSVGDFVFWQGRIYSCLKETQIMDQQNIIQFPTYATIPAANVFPNSKSGALYWKDEGEFVIEANDYPTLPTDGTDSSWVYGDNRDPLYVKGVVDLAIWMLHSRIAPMNIPKLRIDNKDFTFAWLSSIRNGEEMTDITPIQPLQGDRIRWGSDTKKDNGYG